MPIAYWSIIIKRGGQVNMREDNHSRSATEPRASPAGLDSRVDGQSATSWKDDSRHWDSVRQSPRGGPEIREEIRLLLGINKGVVDQVSVDIDRHLAD
jgi:hypothetical protein